MFLIGESGDIVNVMPVKKNFETLSRTFIRSYLINVCQGLSLGHTISLFKCFPLKINTNVLGERENKIPYFIQREWENENCVRK